MAVAAVVLLVPVCAQARDAQRGWRTHAPMPDARTEVVAATVGSGIAVVGGYLPDRSSAARADVYSPRTNRWRRLPDLPLGVNHAMAAGYRGSFYVVGGYDTNNRHSARAFVLAAGARRWRSLPDLPEPRAAAGAAVVGSRLYVVGGTRPGGLAEFGFVLDLRNPRRWRAIPGPTPREHLAVTSWGGRVYALGGRLGGLATNLSTLESYTPGARRWQTLPPVPSTRGGTGAAATRGLIVSVGGEEPAGTIASVYAYNVRTRRWRRLPDLPTPRHGLGVASLGGRVYAIGGGTEPGFTFSSANESLAP